LKRYKEKAKKFNDYDCVLSLMGRQLKEWKGRVVWISYETIITWGRRYLESLFEQLGLSVDRYPWKKLVLRDENNKYLR